MRKSALAWGIELFGPSSRSLLTAISFCIRSAVASGNVVIPQCLYHILILFISGCRKPYSYLNSYFTQTMDLNFAYHSMVLAFCCKAAIVLIEQHNIHSKLVFLKYTLDEVNLCQQTCLHW